MSISVDPCRRVVGLDHGKDISASDGQHKYKRDGGERRHVN
jgi:hypothetical protein